MMSITLEGFDDLRRKLEDLGRRAEALDGTHNVPMSELFSSQFMGRYTDFGTIDEMFAASGFTVDSTEDFAKIPDDEWEVFVTSRTRFASWEGMRRKAATEWTAKKLGF